ncbi:uncharacterized protein [Heliangelus exortis]|uniref:uncharacterized protein n=1 Tax=Heliangelus exortis TaxID=472823 RepID=UPI003A94F38C
MRGASSPGGTPGRSGAGARSDPSPPPPPPPNSGRVRAAGWCRRHSDPWGWPGREPVGSPGTGLGWGARGCAALRCVPFRLPSVVLRLFITTLAKEFRIQTLRSCDWYRRGVTGWGVSGQPPISAPALKVPCTMQRNQTDCTFPSLLGPKPLSTMLVTPFLAGLEGPKHTPSPAVFMTPPQDREVYNSVTMNLRYTVLHYFFVVPH